MIAGHPASHKVAHYRCFLPDLAGFVILCCAGPGYQTEIAMLPRPYRKNSAGSDPDRLRKVQAGLIPSFIIIVKQFRRYRQRLSLIANIRDAGSEVNEKGVFCAAL